MGLYAHRKYRRRPLLSVGFRYPQNLFSYLLTLIRHRNMGRKKKKPSKPWCWYCNRDFDEKKFFYNIKKLNILSVIYVIKSCTQVLVFLYIVCRFTKKPWIEFQTLFLIEETSKLKSMAWKGFQSLKSVIMKLKNNLVRSY